MPDLTFSRPELDAFKVCWTVGSEGLPDDRWVAVEKAVAEAPADLDGADVELTDEAYDDARSAFAVGWEGFVPSGPKDEALLAEMDGAARVLGIGHAPTL